MPFSESRNRQGPSINSTINSSQNKKKKQLLMQKLETQTRMWVNWIVYGGLTVNIFLVVGLLLYFNSRTSKRFDKLSKNIVALGANKEIPGHLDGADELAMLDDVVPRSIPRTARSRAIEARSAWPWSRTICALL